MTPTHARELLTPEALSITVTTLVALDSLQADAWNTRYEGAVKQAHPHGESMVLSLANEALRAFTLSALPGNAHGVNMLVSAFVNGLQILELREEMHIAMAACSAKSITL